MEQHTGSAMRNTATAIAARNQLNSPLLRLPAELRNRIYGHVLTQGQIQVAGSWGCDICTLRCWAQHVHNPRHLLNILLVCQQTWAESRLLVFKLNLQVGDILAILAHVAKVLIMEQRSKIQEFRLEIPHYDIFHSTNNKVFLSGGHPLHKALQHLSGLKRLRKIVLVHVHGSSERRLYPSDVANIRQKLREDVHQGVELEFVQELRDADLSTKL